MHFNSSISLFVVFWALLGIGGSAFFLGSRDAKLKRKLFPLYITAVSAIFLGFMYFQVGAGSLLPALIFVPLIGFLNVSMTTFCDFCGATLISRVPFSTPRFCQKCGAKLTDGP
jgi:hypothetical protein